MAIFQCHIQVISRGEGRSVVSAAAYRSASRIENNYTGLTDDYTQKGWVEYSEIILGKCTRGMERPGCPVECGGGSRKEPGLQAGTGD